MVPRSFEQKGMYEIIIAAVSKLRDHELLGPRVTNKWLSAETWRQALSMSRLIDPSIEVSDYNFNKAMSSKKCPWCEEMGWFDGSNTTGVFQLVYKKTKYYYVTERGKQVSYPFPLDNEWKARVAATGAEALIIPVTRSRPAGRDDKAEEDENEEATQGKNKRQRTVDSVHVSPATTFKPQQTNYWQSPEAASLFHPLETDGDAKDTIQRRVKMLQSVHETEDGWRNVVDGRDPKDFCSKTDIFIVRQRSAILCCAYQLALDHMNDWTWRKCCEEACEQMNRVGLKQATHYKTVTAWNIAFRRGENFPHPNPQVRCGKVPLPSLFEEFPEAKDSFVAFAVNNLTELTLESLHEFTTTKLMHDLFEIWQREQSESWQWQGDSEFLTMERFLETHGLRTVSLTTAQRPSPSPLGEGLH
jgi:hypothetical protein